MIFETARLIVRQWTPGDAADAFAIYRDPLVTRFLGNTAPHADLAQTRAWLDRLIARYETNPPGLGFWAVEHRESGRVIGAALLAPLPETESVEVGYHLGRDWWGQGYATEIGAGCLRHGFEVVQLPRIAAIVFPENTASLHVMEKLGLRPEGRRQYRQFELEFFAIEAAEWAAAQAGA